VVLHTGEVDVSFATLSTASRACVASNRGVALLSELGQLLVLWPFPTYLPQVGLLFLGKAGCTLAVFIASCCPNCHSYSHFHSHDQSTGLNTSSAHWSFSFWSPRRPASQVFRERVQWFFVSVHNMNMIYHTFVCRVFVGVAPRAAVIKHMVISHTASPHSAPHTQYFFFLVSASPRNRAFSSGRSSYVKRSPPRTGAMTAKQYLSHAKIRSNRPSSHVFVEFPRLMLHRSCMDGWCFDCASSCMLHR